MQPAIAGCLFSSHVNVEGFDFRSYSILEEVKDKYFEYLSFTSLRINRMKLTSSRTLFTDLLSSEDTESVGTNFVPLHARYRVQTPRRSIRYARCCTCRYFLAGHTLVDSVPTGRSSNETRISAPCRSLIARRKEGTPSTTSTTSTTFVLPTNTISGIHETDGGTTDASILQSSSCPYDSPYGNPSCSSSSVSSTRAG